MTRDVRWFVTTEGYEHLFISTTKRFGEYAGKFLYGKRCVGYFDTEEKAVQCVLENWGDIHEFSYPYAVVEGLGSGLYPHDAVNSERFFWWFGGRYIEISRPHWAERTCNFGIG